MYNAQLVISRIDELRKSKGYTNMEKFLKELKIGKGTLWAMTDNKGIGCFALAKIADKLECSTDYLLGRTENPDMTISITNSNTTINAPQNNGIGNVTSASSRDDETLLNLAHRLTPIQYARVLVFIDDLLRSSGGYNEGRKEI